MNRMSKNIKLSIYKNIKTNIDILDVSTFKTIQFKLMGWIKLNPQATQNEINKYINKSQRQIKIRIENLARKTNRYQRKSIAIIDTGEVVKEKRVKKYQFYTINVCIYNKSSIYNRKNVIEDIQPLIQQIIDNDIEDRDILEFLSPSVRRSGQYEQRK